MRGHCPSLPRPTLGSYRISAAVRNARSCCSARRRCDSAPSPPKRWPICDLLGDAAIVPRMVTVPPTAAAPVLRTDFADGALWERLKAEITSPNEEGFLPTVEFVNDRRFDGVGESDVIAGLPGRYPHAYPHPVLFVVDAVTAGSPEHPILVLDAHDEPEPPFRSTPRGIQSIENNLSIANMDFEEFAAAVDPDGIFRGF